MRKFNAITIIMISLFMISCVAVANDKTVQTTPEVDTRAVAKVQLERLAAEQKVIFDRYIASDMGKGRELLVQQYNSDVAQRKEQLDRDIEALVSASSESDKRLLQELLNINNAIQYWRSVK